MLQPETLWIAPQSACVIALVCTVVAGCDAAEVQWRPPAPVTAGQVRRAWARFTVALSAFLLLYAAVAERVVW